MNCYPEILMKNKVVSDGAREFSMTCIQNQLAEMQAFSRIEVRRGHGEEKMLKMKVDPEISMKTKN
jgi:hypothetical protein